ncbi:zf-HC2 domain-containing protein [uncultured Croceitalea sp.]|uniref:zf-HC2 domain-containing protein n=1 Tax=uncultured Croceitalea sp. TaxID=1798908 RepID=UPI0033060C3E
MDTNHITDLLPDYIDDMLSATQKKEVEAHLKTCVACTKELEEYSTLFKGFQQEKMMKPSAELSKNFEKMLADEKDNSVRVVSIDNRSASSSKNWFSSSMKVAASIALLIAAFVGGRYFQSEESQKEIASIESERLQLKQTTMISLMENQSASKRIQGVQFIEEFEKPDEAIVKALANRMLKDENTNVRLTAAEALSKFSKSELVKLAFIEALETEKDPSVQIAIIQNLVKTQEKKAVKSMQKLLEQEDTQPFIKEEINQILSEII